MTSNALGKGIPTIEEVTHIASHGWLLTGSQELFMSYDDFPWFKGCTSQKNSHVQEPTP